MAMKDDTRERAKKFFEEHKGNVSNHSLHSYFSPQEIQELQNEGLVVNGPNPNTWTYSLAGKKREAKDDKPFKKLP